MSPEYGLFIKFQSENPESARRLCDQIRGLVGREAVDMLSFFEGTLASKPKQWLTKKQAASYLQVSERTIGRYMKSGLKAHRMEGRGHLRFSPDELDMFELPSK